MSTHAVFGLICDGVKQNERDIFSDAAADCNNCFCAAGSLSIREARMAWTVAGT
jgi:hypothetical protein